MLTTNTLHNQPSTATQTTAAQTHLWVEPVGHRRTLEPVQVLRVEDSAPFGFAHEMQQPKVHLMAPRRAKKRKTKCRVLSISPPQPVSLGSIHPARPRPVRIYATSERRHKKVLRTARHKRQKQDGPRTDPCLPGLTKKHLLTSKTGARVKSPKEKKHRTKTQRDDLRQTLTNIESEYSSRKARANIATAGE